MAKSNVVFVIMRVHLVSGRHEVCGAYDTGENAQKFVYQMNAQTTEQYKSVGLRNNDYFYYYNAVEYHNYDIEEL